MLLGVAVLLPAVVAAAGRRVFFLHLHKGAGTFVCGMARDNGMRTSASNCNVQADQRCCGGDTEADHIRFAAQTPYDFVASESYMYEAMAPGVFAYVTVLRRSWDRYVSHFRHVARAYGRPSQEGEFMRWVDGQPDNWNVLFLLLF